LATDISEEIRRQVTDRANRQCEYCLIREEDSGFRHQVDHIVSRKHGGAPSLENLALACVLCNRYKGTDIAAIDSETSGVTLLFNPRQDRWDDHYRIENGRIVPTSPVGRVTASLLSSIQPNASQNACSFYDWADTRHRDNLRKSGSAREAGYAATVVKPSIKYS
jgi:hypothetical protein